MDSRAVLFLCLVTVFNLPGLTNSATNGTPAQDTCEQWSQMATDLTGSGKHQTCTSASPPNCTRIDCSGTVRFSNFLLPGTQQSPLELDYCFGGQLHSCTQPVSIDFYLQLPKFSFARAFRVSEDQTIDLSAVNVPLGSMGFASPQLVFQFERQSDGRTILFSVVSKIKVHQNGHSFFIDDLEKTLVDQETIHTIPCPNKVRPAAGSQPPDGFMPQCHPQTHGPQTTVKPAVPVQGSKTLSKSCDSTHFCSEGEICDTSAAQAKCICSPDLILNAEKTACMKQSRIGLGCTSPGDCGVNELCQSEKLTCQCDHGNEFDTVRNMCVRPPTDHKHTPKAEPTTTTAPGKDKTTEKTPTGKGGKTGPAPPKGPSTSTGTDKQVKSGESKVPIIVGATLGGFALLTGVVIANIYVFRRYRRRRQHRDSGIISEISAPLLGSDDDDTNLIM